MLEDPILFFRLQNGRALRSIEELLQYIPEMPQEEFTHHVTNEKNDFSTWVQDVFEESDLAQFIRDAHSPAELQELLVSWKSNNEENKTTLQKKTTSEAEEQTNQETKTEENTKDSIEEVHDDTAEKTEDALAVEKTNNEKSDNYHFLTTIPEPEPLDQTPVEELFPDISSVGLDPDKQAELNDKIADKFDEFSKKMEEATQHVVSDTITKRIEVLQERERELRTQISETRRAGYDPFMADIILQRFEARLQLAKATEEETDFKLVETTLTEAEKEIEEAKQHPPLNIKKEIEELAQATPAQNTSHDQTISQPVQQTEQSGES